MKVEKIIKDNLTEYKVELKLIDSSNFNRLEFEVYSREKGKRKWNFLEFSRQDELKLKELWSYSKRKEHHELLLSLVREKIPDIKEILQEMQKELAEEVKKQYFNVKFWMNWLTI